MKLFAIAAVTLLTSLASCNNDDINPDNSVVDVKEKNVFIKMENPPLSATRSDSESGLTKKAVLTTGVVIFVNGDIITRYVNLSTSGLPAYIEPTTAIVPTISISNMSVGGVQFTNIKADKVYIIGNRIASQLAGLPIQAEDGTIPTGSKMSELIKAAGSLLNVTVPADMNDGNQANVPLYGMNTLTKGAGGDNDYRTAIILAPIVARLEIKEVFASDVTFDLSGIFVNNYYTLAQVDGAIATTAILKNNLNIPANYLEAYHATALRDWSVTSLGTKTGNATSGVSIKPTNVWGYNVFAAKNVAAGDKNLPRIVLRLKNVKDALGESLTDGEGNIVDKFITVTGFNDGTNTISEFKPGYVYTITKIAFNKSNITEEPEIADRIINATVTVSVRAWIDGGEINPEI